MSETLKDIIIAMVSFIAPVLVLTWTLENEKRMKLIELFNEKYRNTFSLRTKLSHYLFKKEKIHFYYELDIILSDSYIEEKILDYLTEMEDFFLLLPYHFLTTCAFKKLISLAFYQRMIFLFPYVLYKRRTTGSNSMFTNYEKAINIMKATNKIKTQGIIHDAKCYIGIRESDIRSSGDFFKSNICMFSEDGKQYSIRTNQNIPDKDVLTHMKQIALEKHTCNTEYKFYFYNQMVAYNYPREIIHNSVCINKKEILEFLNNKVCLKEWFDQNKIPIVNYETFLGNEIIYATLTKHFEQSNTFVIQDAHGGGGIGTYCVTCKNCSKISQRLQPFQRYLVSPFIPNISVNTHVFVADKQTVLSPGSIQIIEKRDDQLCYRGADFIAFRDLSLDIRNQIKFLSLKLADMLRQKGYRGIAGIDFMVTGANDIYCCEINPRFQASSLLLDQYLQAKKALSAYEAGSCFEINEMAFKGCMCTTLTYEDIIDYSCYFYYKDDSNIDYIKYKYHLYKSIKKGVNVLSDGVNYYFSTNKKYKNYHIREKSYLFRAIFNHGISQISPEKKLWINDNICIEPIPDSQLRIKIGLLNQGVRISSSIKEIKTGVYESIDIKILESSLITSGLQINCAYGIHLSQYSPYNIRKENGKQVLYYYNDYIAHIEIEQNRLMALSESSQKILYLATDRLRIKTITGCENKNMGKGCEFCNLPPSKTRFTMCDIEQSLNELKCNQISFRHILIGGGSCLDPDIWDTIMEICQCLRNDEFYKNKPISIMTMLPPKEMLAQLKDAGVEEVAFNLEIANEELAGVLMPGKRSQDKRAYYDVLKEAVSVFGIGKVRSALLVGMDKEKELYDEITTLAGLGVLPCLSAFRALPNTLFEKQSGPSNQYLLKVYENAVGLLAEMDGTIKELGPDCKECRNNMLAI